MRYTKNIKIYGVIVIIMIVSMTNCTDKSSSKKSDISHLTSMEITRLMGAGWNLGNTLDAHWNKAAAWITNPSVNQIETLWGNPITTKAMIDKVKESGFNTVRVPVTWYIFTGPAPDYVIEDRWMDRVQEVVDYVIDNGMFCILNIHHDDYNIITENGSGVNGWLRLHDSGTTALSAVEKQTINERFAKLWQQIAHRFKDYNEYLIFEGINEPRSEGFTDNAAVWAELYSVLNNLNQIFVDTVRAGSGFNPVRHLMVTPYFASIDPHGGFNTLSMFVNNSTGRLRINDPQNRLIVSLHYYEPYYFAGLAASDSNSLSIYDPNDNHISNNRGRVLNILNEFLNRGIPVIMGETGALDKGNEAERVKWANDYVKQVREMGVPVVIWDDGGSFKLLDRRNLTWYYPDLVKALVE